jgi:hypothetical protein
MADSNGRRDARAPDSRGSQGQRRAPESVLEVSVDRDPAGQSLNGAARGRLGYVLAPRRLFMGGPAPKLVAITNPLDPVVLHEDHLDGSGRECIRPQHRHGGLGFRAPA